MSAIEYIFYLDDDAGDAALTGDIDIPALANFKATGIEDNAGFIASVSIGSTAVEGCGIIDGELILPLAQFIPDEDADSENVTKQIAGLIIGLNEISDVDSHANNAALPWRIEDGILYHPPIHPCNYESAEHSSVEQSYGFIRSVSASSSSGWNIINGNISIPLAHSYSTVDWEGEGLIKAVYSSSDVEAPYLEHGVLKLPSYGPTNLASFREQNKETVAGLISAIDVNSDIDECAIYSGAIQLPLAHAPIGSTNPRAGFIYGIALASSIDGSDVDDWYIDKGVLYHPPLTAKVEYAFYNIDSVANQAGIISGIGFNSDIDAPTIDNGHIYIPSRQTPLADYIPNTIDPTAGLIRTIDFDSSIDAPRIEQGRIYLPTASGLPGIWSLSAVDGAPASNANQGGYNVPWSAFSFSMSFDSGGVECGTLMLPAVEGVSPAEVELTMYAYLSPEGYLRFNFLKAS